MKNVSKALGSATVMCALAACGGSSGDMVNSQMAAGGGISGISSTGGSLVSEDAIQAAASVSLTGTVSSSTASDLSILNARLMTGSGSSHSVEFEFDIADSGSGEIELDALSVALEIAASGSFNDSYRQPLFDIQQSDSSDSAGGLSLTARGATSGLPAGNYNARLVVNPNWQNAFDIVPADRDQSQPFHFIEESDYSNNASDGFALAIDSTMTCVEDMFEDNDSIATATVIPVGGQIEASLCTDMVDFYAIELAAGESTSIYFDYLGDTLNQASKYVLLDSMFTTIAASVARESNDIKINATLAGTYYLGVYGPRSSYLLTREPSFGTVFPENFANDFVNNEFFTDETAAGPQSWQLGDVALNKLVFTESALTGQVIDCGRITTQFRDDQPVAYVTPDHFADIYKFRFLEGGAYVVDGELSSGWGIQNGDIFNDHWYDHDYPGYAQITGSHDWRYWSADGLSYIDCSIEVN